MNECMYVRMSVCEMLCSLMLSTTIRLLHEFLPVITNRADKSLSLDRNQRQLNTAVTIAVHRLCPNVHCNINLQGA